MDEWILWMIAAGVLAVGEMFTLGFFAGPIAIAAVFAAIVALAGGGVALQLVVFCVTAVASVGVLRPIARRHLRTPAQLRTGTAPRALAAFRNLAISAIRLAGRANIAHARRDLHEHNDAFAALRI